MNQFYTVGIGLSIVLVAFCILELQNLQQQEALATGGAGEIKGLIDPIIERAITALQQNNTDLALEEITSLKQELDDTFSVDEKEDKDKDEDED